MSDRIIMIEDSKGLDTWQHGPFASVEDAKVEAVRMWDHLSEADRVGRMISVCVYLDEAQIESGDIEDVIPVVPEVD